MAGHHPRTHWVLASVLALATTPLLAGCLDAAPGVDDEQVVSTFEQLLAGDGRVYTPEGAGSTVRLKMLTPADPTAGLAEGGQPVRFLLYDTEDAAPITDATATLKAEMLSMGHGTSGEEAPVHQGGGVYEGKTEWNMVGGWLLNIDVTLADGTELEFDVDVQVGAPTDDEDDDHDVTFASFDEAMAAGGPISASGSGDAMLHLKLLQPADPANVTKGKHDIRVLLYAMGDDGATPVTDATFHLESWMPPHEMEDGSMMPGHGAPDEEAPVHVMHGVYEGATNHVMNGTWWTYLNLTYGGHDHSFKLTFHVGEGTDHHDHDEHHHGDHGHGMPANFTEALEREGAVLNATNGTTELLLKVLAPHDVGNVTQGMVNLTFLLYKMDAHEEDPPADMSASVDIQGFAFSPDPLEVEAGTTVTWTNQDSAPHTVTSTDGPESFDSGNMNQDATFAVTFDTPGTYEYRCDYHSSMTGTVVVSEADASHEHAEALPVEDATVEVDVHMHVHGGDTHHAGSVTQPGHLRDGIYVGGANLTMDGEWSVHVHVTLGDGTTFTFRVHLAAGGHDEHDHTH